MRALLHATRPMRLFALLFTLLCAVAGSPAGQGQESGASPSLSVDRNVYSAGGNVRPSAPVGGDFSAAGGRVVLDQPVAGDAALAGGSVQVQAPVGGDLRAGGGDVRIDTAVGGELFAAGGNVVLGPATRVGREATLYAGELRIEGGRIEQGLTARARRIVLDAEVGGDVNLAAERIELGPAARIGGALHYLSRAELVRAEGAQVAGPVTRGELMPQRAERPREPARVDGGVSWIGGSLLFLGLLALAAVFMLVAPAFAMRSGEQVIRSPWLSIALGFVAAIAVPVLAALLFITVLGIPLGLLVLSFYPVLLLLGFLVGVLFIARLLARALRRAASESFALSFVFFALALVTVLLLANVPIAGPVVVVLLALAGLGALSIEIRSRLRGPDRF